MVYISPHVYKKYIKKNKRTSVNIKEIEWAKVNKYKSSGNDLLRSPFVQSLRRKWEVNLQSLSGVKNASMHNFK